MLILPHTVASARELHRKLPTRPPRGRGVGDGPMAVAPPEFPLDQAAPSGHRDAPGRGHQRQGYTGGVGQPLPGLGGALIAACWYGGQGASQVVGAAPPQPAGHPDCCLLVLWPGRLGVGGTAPVRVTDDQRPAGANGVHSTWPAPRNSYRVAVGAVSPGRPHSSACTRVPPGPGWAEWG